MTREELRAALDAVTVVDAQPPALYGQRQTFLLLVVSVHERGTLRQTWLGVDPA